jgi:hypothetical protein
MDYWVLAKASEQGAIIDSYPQGGPSDWKYDEGMRLAKDFPRNATILFSPNFPKHRKLEDFQPNILNALIVSPRTRAVVESIAVQNAEFLPVQVKDHKKKVVAKDYAFLNLIGTVDAIDLSRATCEIEPIDPTRFDQIRKLALDQKRIPPEAKMFRLARRPSVIVVDDDVRKAFEKAQLTGYKLHPAEGWDELFQS